MWMLIGGGGPSGYKMKARLLYSLRYIDVRCPSHVTSMQTFTSASYRYFRRTVSPGRRHSPPRGAIPVRFQSTLSEHSGPPLHLTSEAFVCKITHSPCAPGLRDERLGRLR